MKKAAILALFAAGIAIAFSSCTKCKTCTAYNRTTHVVVDEEHLCAHSLAMKTWENNYKTEWDYGDTYVECKKTK